MNKKVSKTLAAVLSAAMAASAFAMSTGAAFAANSATANTVNAASESVAITTDTNGRSDYNLVRNYQDLQSYASLFTIVYQGHSYTANSISFAKGFTWEPADAASERLVSVTGNGDVRVKNPLISNRQVATVRRKVNISATGEVGKHGNQQTISAEAYLTVELYIYPDNGYAVLPEDNVNKDGTLVPRFRTAIRFPSMSRQIMACLKLARILGQVKPLSQTLTQIGVFSLAVATATFRLMQIRAL